MVRSSEGFVRDEKYVRASNQQHQEVKRGTLLAVQWLRLHLPMRDVQWGLKGPELKMESDNKVRGTSTPTGTGGFFSSLGGSQDR